MVINGNTRSVDALKFSNKAISFNTLATNTRVARKAIGIDGALSLHNRNIVRISSDSIMDSMSHSVSSTLSLARISSNGDAVGLISTRNTRILNSTNGLRLRSGGKRVLSDDTRHSVRRGKRGTTINACSCHLADKMGGSNLCVNCNLARLSLRTASDSTLILDSGNGDRGTTSLDTGVANDNSLTFDDRGNRAMSLSGGSGSCANIASLHDKALLLGGSGILNGARRLHLTTRARLSVGNRDRAINALGNDTSSLLDLGNNDLAIAGKNASANSLAKDKRLGVRNNALSVTNSGDGLATGIGVTGSTGILMDRTRKLNDTGIRGGNALTLGGDTRGETTTSIGCALNNGLAGGNALVAKVSKRRTNGILIIGKGCRNGGNRLMVGAMLGDSSSMASGLIIRNSADNAATIAIGGTNNANTGALGNVRLVRMSNGSRNRFIRTNHVITKTCSCALTHKRKTGDNG